MRRAYGQIVFLTCVVLTSGCPGSLENPDRFAGVTCELNIDVERDVLQAKCGGMDCHNSGAAPAAGLDLESPDVLQRLIDVPGRACNGRALIQSDAPDGSQLLDRVQDTPECGLRMPLGGDVLPADERNCLRAWVFEAVTGTNASALRGHP
ncbi:MAG: hypothetical protein RMA76_13045 [Deltaproteobacteria bacterium]|jgi:hypothetical protein